MRAIEPFCRSDQSGETVRASFTSSEDPYSALVSEGKNGQLIAYKRLDVVQGRVRERVLSATKPDPGWANWVHSRLGIAATEAS
jgi:hypothetical protein